ncbi:unnamed protein product [Strongylus vulgaris]|uniref:Uncharacterized protein n=1 Tax=Strongylus vulgaris TaxID=40348 RepID=A0A3P7KPU0_STRVU|nr:unnamed protein product [Strongylus vulgaris]
MQALNIMESISDEDREALIDHIHEADDDKEIIRKVSAYGMDIKKFTEALKTAIKDGKKA